MAYGVRAWLSRLARRAWLLGAIIVAVSALVPTPSVARGPRKRPPVTKKIDPTEGRQRIAAFRQQRLAGDYCFRFEGIHKPRRGRTQRRYRGILWGTWTAAGARTRLALFPIAGGPAIVDLLVQNGYQPQAWIKYPADPKPRVVPATELEQPMVSDLLHTPLDLQMPFIYWPATYIASERVKNQPAHCFQMIAPQPAAKGATIVQPKRAIHAQHNVLIRTGINYLVDPKPRVLPAAELELPMVPDFLHPPLDLPMLFIDWPATYSASARGKNQPVHCFQSVAPQSVAKGATIVQAKLAIHAQHNALIRAILINAAGTPVRTIDVMSYAKVANQWIIKTLDVVDEQTHETTRFRVIQAALDLQLPASIFTPEQLGIPPEPISPQLFQYL